MSESESRLQGLLMRGLAGEQAAYHRFLQGLSQYVRGYLRVRMRGVPDEVEDVVQEVLLAVHNQRHTYDASLPLAAWVHAITRYKLIDFLRRRAVREALHEPLDDEAAFFANAEADASDARRDLAGLLARLPDRQRLPIQYVKIEGLTVAEAARRTGMSESAVKVGVHRGLKALAALLRNTHEDR